MKKKVYILFMSLTLAFGVTACAKTSGTVEDTPKAPETETEIEADTDVQDQTNMPAETEAETEVPDESGQESKVLIAYFTIPEDLDTTGVDAVAGASIVVKEEEVLGNTEYVARTIQETVGGDLFQIETVQEYPLDHDPLVDQAAEEKAQDARPELSTHIEDVDQYDTILLGYPNWWGDLPMPVYTFLETYDFGQKTIIPFVTHGGSSFSGTIDTIARLQPDAVVSDQTLSLSRNDVAESEEEVVSWAKSLNLNE